MCDRCSVLAADKLVESPGRPGYFYRRCDTCRRPIPKYEAMQGAGFQSHTVDHYHDESFGRGKALRIPVLLELCHECYLKDFQIFCPNSPLPDIANVKV